MIVTVTFNPAIDKTAFVDELLVGGLNRLKDVRSDAGGKGVNVSKTIAKLGGTSLCTGFLAGASGRFIEDALNEAGIAHDFVWVPGSTRTNLKVLNAQMELTELNEPGPQISPEQTQTLLETIISHADSYTVLSGNVSPGVPADIYRTLTEKLRASGIQVILDADGELFRQALPAGPAVIKPNRFELAQYFGVEEPSTPEATAALARPLLNENTKLVVVSMGGEGALFLDADHTIYCPVLKIELNSAVGAGDAMVAAISYALEQNYSLEELAVLAMATSAGACTTAGTRPAEPEVVAALKEQVIIKEI